MNWDLITAVLFYAIAAILIYKYRHKFEVIEKIFIVHKTKKGLSLMKRLAKYRRFWKVFSTIAIPVAFFFMLLVGYLLLTNLVEIFTGTADAGVAILIPGVRIPGSPFYVPFWQGIISIAVLAIVHEFCHGIVAVVEKVKLKSTGFGFLTILPLAFVEMDEKKLAKIKPLSRMRILASGAFGNVVLWGILMLVMMFTFVPVADRITHLGGIRIAALDSGMPAELSGMGPEEVITSINGISTVSLQEFFEELGKISPGETVTVGTDAGEYSFETVESPIEEGRAYIGVSVTQSLEINQDVSSKYGYLVNVFMWVFDLVRWIALLNLLVGIMNFMPIWVLDGGRILYDLTGYVVKNKKVLNLLMNIVFSFYLVILVLNLVGPLLRRFSTFIFNKVL